MALETRKWKIKEGKRYKKYKDVKVIRTNPAPLVFRVDENGRVLRMVLEEEEGDTKNFSGR